MHQYFIVSVENWAIQTHSTCFSSGVPCIFLFYINSTRVLSSFIFVKEAIGVLTGIELMLQIYLEKTKIFMIFFSSNITYLSAYLGPLQCHLIVLNFIYVLLGLFAGNLNSCSYHTCFWKVIISCWL